MKIYTSYFAKAGKLSQIGIIPISISLYPPKWWIGSQLRELAPTKSMLSSSIFEEEYTRLYKRNILEELNAKEIIGKLSEKYKNRDIALCCFESPDKFCHRHLVAEWIEKETGIKVEEYKFENKNPTSAKYEQLELY